MDLPAKAIEELKNLYRKHQGVELSNQDAREIAETVLNLFSLVYKPIPKRLLEEQKDEFPELVQLFDKTKKSG